MQKITLIGNLTKDPDRASLASGKNLVRFDMATTRMGKDKNGNAITDYWKIAVWNEKLGDSCMKYLGKGSKVCVIGESQPYLSENNGKSYLNNNVSAQEVEFLASKPKEEPKEEPIEEPDPLPGLDNYYDDIPF